MYKTELLYLLCITFISHISIIVCFGVWHCVTCVPRVLWEFFFQHLNTQHQKRRHRGRAPAGYCEFCGENQENEDQTTPEQHTQRERSHLTRQPHTNTAERKKRPRARERRACPFRFFCPCHQKYKKIRHCQDCATSTHYKKFIFKFILIKM